MRKTFTTQPPLFVRIADVDHPILHGLDDAEAVLDWAELKRLMSSIYASKTGRLNRAGFTACIADKNRLHDRTDHRHGAR